MAKKKSRKKSDAVAVQHARLKWIVWSVLLGAWLLLVASLLSFDPLDPPAAGVRPYNDPPANLVGLFGAKVAWETYSMLGPGVWVGLAGLAVWLVAGAIGKKVSQLALRIIGVALMSVSTSCLLAVMMPGAISGFGGGPLGSGGLLAVTINDELLARFATFGTLIILAVAWIAGSVLAADQVVMAIPRWIGEGVARITDTHLPRVSFAGISEHLPRLPFGRSETSGKKARRAAPARKPKKKRSKREDEEEWIDEDAGGLGGTESFDPEDHHGLGEDDEELEDGDAEYEYEYEYEYEDGDEDEDDAEAEAAWEEDDEEAYDDEEEDEEDADAADAPGAYLEDKKKFTPDELRAKMAMLPINFAPAGKATTAPPREPDLSGYQFPDLDVLEEPESNFSEEQESVVREQAMNLQHAMQQYKIEGEVVNIDSGPVITLFEVRLTPGTKVSKLQGVSSDLARALKSQNIRIVPNMAGKDTVGVEVPNLRKERVRLKELMTREESGFEKMKLPMFLGKDASGNPLVQDLNKMPHMLIAGTTGSGKSVCMNSIIMSFLYTKRPDELKLVLVDPKMVEMSQFKDIPHLMCPVVTEMSKAAAILEWAVTKMDERYELLAEAGVRDIASYNGLGWEELKERMEPGTEEEEARIPKKLPYLVFIIDELADLMMTNKEVEGSIVRIAQKARAVGIHLILATQRPSANVVTGLIKSNMPCRVCMKVASGMDSRIILDQKGGELLLGHGDMLFLSPRSSELTRAQGTLVDDHEIRSAVKFLKTISEQSFEPQLVQLKGGDAELSAERDDMFDDAVRIVLETGRGSVSLLQRRLTIGYSRASRIIEEMEACGVLGGHKTAQAREVLISPEEWEAMQAQAQADAAAGTLYAPDMAADAEELLATDADDELAYEEDDDAVPDEFDDEYRQ